MISMSRVRPTLLAIALMQFCLIGTSLAAQPFQLTTVFNIGGGGCVGETRVFADTAAIANSPAIPASGARTGANEESGGPVRPRIRYFLTTVGCSADRVAISLDGRAYLLDAYQFDGLGVPITYVSDTALSPRVRVETLAMRSSVEVEGTACTQRSKKVRVRIEFNGATRVVLGTAITGCP